MILERLFSYSPEVYLSLLGRYNAAIDPNQWFAVCFGVVILLAAYRGGQINGRWAMAIVAGFWAWTGLKFHIEFFSGINYLAPYYGVVFLLQTVLLCLWGVWLGRFEINLSVKPLSLMGLNLMALAMVLNPVLVIAAGYQPDATEAFGVTPMPTVLATLATFALLDRRVPWWLLTVPIVWSVWEALTAWTLGLPHGLVLPALSVLAAVVLTTRAPKELDPSRESNLDP